MEIVIYCLLGVFVLLVALIVLMKSISRRNRNIIILSEVSKVNEAHPFDRFDTAKKNFYDFFLEYPDKVIVVKLFKIPSNGDITINNKYIWQINGSQNLKTIKGVSAFVNGHFESDKEVIKVGLLYPNPYKIRKWINECEMIPVTPKVDCHSVRVLGIDDFKDNIMEL